MRFLNTFKVVWEKEMIPEDQSKGMIIKLPKKGYLSICDNWCGITLLSVPSKVFCKIMLSRIEAKNDKNLRQE